MTMSLYQRLSFALLAVFVVITLVFIFWWQHVEHHTKLESEQRLHLSLAASLARDNPLLQQGVYDHNALKNLFHTLMVLGPAFEFYYVDPKGKILTYSADSSSVKRQSINIEPIRLLNQNRAPLPIFGDDPKHPTRSKIFSAAPVFNGIELQGYLYVIVGGEQYQRTFYAGQMNNRVQMSLWFIVAALVFLFVVMLWLFRSITQPVRKLTEQMLTFQSSGFDINAVSFNHEHDNRGDEVEKLNDVFKQMAQRIDTQFKELGEADQKRKALLTEISHDLRTPLASFKGYIETIALQGETLEPETRQAYIDTALKSASQLNNLIDQIFELAHLESGQTSVNLESFNISELLYDITAKFAMKAESLSVNLSVNDLAKDHYVYSDIGKLERILTNLLDNALRHTPAQGNIELIVDEHESNQLIVSVSDSGTGIKKQETAYIFDARYRASNATSGKHSGLGLAICKKLAELLKSDLKVKSELGKGTVFSFTLNKTQ